MTRRPKPLPVVALSGGKDSTAMALRLAEVEPELDPVYVCTPTGDELPDMVEHWAKLERMLGKSITRLESRLDLNGWIDEFGALPNWRQRWCTRLLKIRPFLDWVATVDRPILALVGLRADEPAREGIISEDTPTRFPMREWGWSVHDVKRYLRRRRVLVPKRTDCARCFFQKLGEWHDLWKHHPDVYAGAIAQEQKYGHTFRSPQRDKQPASLEMLRVKFEGGYIPRGGDYGQLALFDDLTMAELEAEVASACRICKL